MLLWWCIALVLEYDVGTEAFMSAIHGYLYSYRLPVGFLKSQVPADTHKFTCYMELLYLIQIHKCSIKPFNVNVIMQKIYFIKIKFEYI
jgi:hypothetical protein